MNHGLLEAPNGYLLTVFGEFDTTSEAVEAMQRYYQRWPSMGYGTSLRVAERDGKVEVRGSRATHCD